MCATRCVSIKRAPRADIRDGALVAPPVAVFRRTGGVVYILICSRSEASLEVHRLMAFMVTLIAANNLSHATPHGIWPVGKCEAFEIAQYTRGKHTECVILV